MAYVLGIDLGTSAVKVTAVNRAGQIVAQSSQEYAISNPQAGYSEQNPEDWVQKTTLAIQNLAAVEHLDLSKVEGISYSGQMHGLVLMDKNYRVLRPAILWNDTRTTAQCEEITGKLRGDFLKITRNRPLEGFTLPKILWVKENEPEIFAQTEVFLLPKDYVRFRMTGKIGMEYSDAAGTVWLDEIHKTWSKEIADKLALPLEICPPLLESTAVVGNITVAYSAISGLPAETKVIAGAADNAAGAIGAGIISEDKILSSIGTSGVVLAYEKDRKTDYAGRLHFFNHAIPDSYYSMGVTLAAGYSLSWFKQTFAGQQKFTDLVEDAKKSPIGAKGLLFTPYIVGERTPYADAQIRGSFIGMDSRQQLHDFTRAVIEGITFSFRDLLSIYRSEGKHFVTAVATGGGAKSALWMQIQADVFNMNVVSLENEQGPGLGAAMLAAVGVGWFKDLAECSETFVKYGKVYRPKANNVAKYDQIYRIYQQAYSATRPMTGDLLKLDN